MKHPVYINGRDTTLDASFFINELNADPESIVVPEADEECHKLIFTIAGNQYSARWYDFSNSIYINCVGLFPEEDDVADERLYNLSKSIPADAFGDFIVKKIVAWPEGNRPELLILLYEEN